MPEPPVVRVPARDIPPPAHLSPAARSQVNAAMPLPPWPAVNDAEAWRRLAREQDEGGLAMLEAIAATTKAHVAEIDLGDGVRAYDVVPEGIDPDDPAVYLDVHGGSLVWGGGAVCRAMGVITADMVRARVWAVDYRMPPDHPFPVPVDDCAAAYRALLERRAPESIIVGGYSAGGGLAAAALLKTRDQGLPLPAATVLMSPGADLTESGDTFATHLGVDTALTSRMPANLLYADGRDLTDPYLSPLFGDFGAGFPPTLLISGTRDLFLSNTVRLHAALVDAAVPADLHVMEAANHSGFELCPEADHRDRVVRRFVDRHWDRRP